MCQNVRIDDEYKNDEIKKMMNILEDRRKEVRDDVMGYKKYSIVMVTGQ